MAEIEIQRKERSAWPWVLLALVLLALVAWWLFARGDGGVTTETRSGAITDMGRDHQYTADGIRRLAGALGEITDRDTVGGETLRSQVDSLRGLADALQRETQSTNHAQYAHSAFTRAASMMEDLQQRRYRNLGDEVSEVRRAAEAVQPGRPLLEQGAEVQRFFDRAAAALRGMSAASGS